MLGVDHTQEDQAESLRRAMREAEKPRTPYESMIVAQAAAMDRIYAPPDEAERFDGLS